MSMTLDKACKVFQNRNEIATRPSNYCIITNFDTVLNYIVIITLLLHYYISLHYIIISSITHIYYITVIERVV